jgi:hypothetical protein
MPILSELLFLAVSLLIRLHLQRIFKAHSTSRLLLRDKLGCVFTE